MTTYRHTQFGHTIIYPMTAIALAAGIILARAVNPWVGGIVALIVLITIAIFYKLTIVIEDTYVRAIFGPGFSFRKITLADIAACEPIRIRWWYGWGIHLTPYGWLYNVSGWDAVAITLRNGRRVSLGTDQPNELCAAIRRSTSAK
jgi:hypothetical protein